jgi:hypothetical protein
MTVQPNCNLRLGQSYERAFTDSARKAPFQAKITTAGRCTGAGASDERSERPALLIAVPGGLSLGPVRIGVAYQFEGFAEFCDQLALEFINFAYNNWTRPWGFSLQ